MIDMAMALIQKHGQTKLNHLRFYANISYHAEMLSDLSLIAVHKCHLTSFTSYCRPDWQQIAFTVMVFVTRFLKMEFSH